MTRQQRRRRTLWMWRTLMLGLALTKQGFLKR